MQARQRMYRGLTYILLLIMPILMAPVGLLAQNEVFGPERFERTTKTPVLKRRTFSIADTTLTYTLKVTNGTFGSAIVSSAVVIVNGVKIFSPENFNQGVKYLERELTLKKANEISVEVRSAPGSFLEISFIAPFAAIGTIGQTGGIISVEDPNSPIFGTKVVIPENALDVGETATITVSFSDIPPGPLLPGIVQASRVIDLRKNLPYNFKVPVLITIPYETVNLTESDLPGVFFWSTTYNKYRSVAIRGIDRNTKTITFATTHFTSFIGLAINGLSSLAMGESIDSGFWPEINGVGEDSFLIPNFGTYLTPDGNCYGMSLFSIWYYSNKKLIDGMPLFNKWRDGDPGDPQDDIRAQEVVLRAHLGVSQIWSNLQFFGDWLLPGDTALLLWTALKITGEPQLLLLTEANILKGHAVTVYSWDATKSQFGIYDCNFPAERVTLDWTLEGFANYSKNASYSNPFIYFTFDGTSTALDGSEFEAIYNGAEEGWDTSKFNQISIDEPVIDMNNSITLPVRGSVRVHGTVSEGVRPARYVAMYLDGFMSGFSTIDPATKEFELYADLFQRPRSNYTVLLLATDDLRNLWASYAGLKIFAIHIEGQELLKNPGFETGDFTGWAHESHTWQNNTPGSYNPEKSGIENPGFDIFATSLKRVYSGNYSARINNSDPNYHISSLSQTITVPDIINPEIRFNWAAVLEDPSHPPEYQPYVEVSVTNLTTNRAVYYKHFYSNDPSYSGWRTVYANSRRWQTIPWQTVLLDLTDAVGCTIVIKITAGDCGYGAHGGYAYLDTGH